MRGNQKFGDTVLLIPTYLIVSQRQLFSDRRYSTYEEIFSSPGGRVLVAGMMYEQYPSNVELEMIEEFSQEE